MAARHQQQLDLFSRPSLNIGADVKRAMNQAAQDSGLSRLEIVDRMNALADRNGIVLTRGNSRRLTLEIFEKWMNTSLPKRQIPIKALPIFCVAVNAWSPLSALAATLGLRLIGEREQRLLDWAEAKVEIKGLHRRIRKIESEL